MIVRRLRSRHANPTASRQVKPPMAAALLDALNSVGDALTVAVFDAETFDDIFRDMVETNEEGTIARDGKTLENYVFDDATIERLLATEAIAPSGAACLKLACQHRASLLP